MIPSKIETIFIEITTDFKGVIKKINAGNFVKKEFIINDFIFNSCPFLIGTLEALPLNESFVIQAMIIVSDNTEYNVDLELYKSENEVSILIQNSSNVYKFVTQLNQSRNDIFFIKREISKKNKELSELKKLAEKANEEKTRFLAMMSHEVRNPLNTILGYTEMVADEKMSTKAKEYINYLTLASNNLKIIVDDILDLSRIEAGKLEIASEKTDLKQIIRSCFINFKNQHKNNDVALKIDILDNVPKYVYTDGVRITQVISNLLSNALKFTKKGTVSVFAELISETKKTSKISIKIIDTGRGMTEEQTAKVFNEYEQSEINDNRIYGGSGLGLSIVKRLIKAMNGSVTVTSKQNVGTTVSIKIPFKKKRKTVTKNNINTPNSIKKSLKGKLILVADDDLLNQKITSHFLKKEEALTVVVDNGLKALELLKKEKFDMVLLDINMPEISGEELIQLKPILNKNIKTPFLALTGNATREDKDNYIKLGFSDVIFKPFKANELVTKINYNL